MDERKPVRRANKALQLIRQWSRRRSPDATWTSSDLKCAEDAVHQKATDDVEPESLSSSSFEGDSIFTEPFTGSDLAGTRRQSTLLALAVVIFVLGHWELILRAALSVSLPTLSTLAAAAMVVAALWSEAVERWRRRRKQLRYICRQGWDLVESLVHAILKLPECARDIRLALNEIREVVNQLRVINSKIRFLPGRPKEVAKALFMAAPDASSPSRASH